MLSAIVSLRHLAFIVFFFPLHSAWPHAAHRIKQEEGTEEQSDKKTADLEETTQSGEEGCELEEPVTDSPNHLPDGGTGTDGPSDGGIRLPNGELWCIHDINSY